ncbi:TonB-dependent receptor [Sphingobacterium yanglingense]|uniref:Carboxypeptidase-like protein n=1 Tax=Sphingobacterium yanglingense TaxID=1437280 RepID=A0A4R6W475_9SPHI|nr:hypothetical protein [Sphingobacterium yanglingense]TDQ72279.1 hypothetical protein CLV99_4743 [Sphingobacterium yanglingense]
MYIRLLFFLLFLASGGIVMAQRVTIEGILVDKATKDPLNAITILLKSVDGKVITYKASDKNGYFALSTERDLNGAYVEINHLGYKKKSFVPTVGAKMQIELEQSVIRLEEVDIKSKPRIQRVGDTLAYDVSSFAKEEDRSIGDVLKRMPGMEVNESGQIKYQGKAISNFYIDGDDLLDDRYAIGSKTIPHKMVQDVQVLNNHEHKKVLKNKRYTDEVALNLVIKDEAKLKLTGQIKLGGGLPKQYDGELNTILFNKKYKLLNVLQGNNVGRDLSGAFTGFNKQTVLSSMGSSPVNNLLGLGTVGAPPVNKDNYFMNNSVALDVNNLINTKGAWQYKSNVQLLVDRNTFDYAGSTTFNTNGEVYGFDEKQHTVIKQWMGAFRFTAAKNQEKNYISNALSLEYQKENGSADIYSNGESIRVAREFTVEGFSNQLEYIPALKNGDIIQVNWFMNYGKKPQTLALSPGIFPDLMNAGLPYEETGQYMEVPSFFSRASVGYRLPNKKVGQYYSAGISVEDQKLNSSIDRFSIGMALPVTLDSSFNDTDWLRTSLFVQGEYEWKTRRFSSRLTLPLSLQQTHYEDSYFALDHTQNRFLFNPVLNAKYVVGVEDELSFSYRRENSFGNIEGVYRGLIIQNYRTLNRNRGGINESRSNDFGLNYKLSKTIQLLFVNIELNYNQSIASAMLSNVVDNDITQTQLVSRENRVNSYRASLGVDKYIFPLASTVKLEVSWTLTDYNQLFNNELLPFQNISYSLTPAVEAKIWESLNLSYRGQLSWSSTRQGQGGNGLGRNAFNMSQSLGLPLSLFKLVHLQTSARHLYSSQQGLERISYVFFDTFARYRHKKWNTDFELSLSNIANVKKFETYTISANMQGQNSYELRGRMAILRAVFNFK